MCLLFTVYAAHLPSLLSACASFYFYFYFSLSTSLNSTETLYPHIAHTLHIFPGNLSLIFPITFSFSNCALNHTHTRLHGVSASLIGNFFISLIRSNFSFSAFVSIFACRAIRVRAIFCCHSQTCLIIHFDFTFSILAIDQKPVILLSPNIRVQTISPSKSKTIIATDARKKSLIDSGIEMFFKKNPKQSISDHLTPNVLHKFNTEVTSVPISTLHGDGGGGDGGNDNGRDKDATDDGHKWKFFETIKIHTDKRHGNDPKSA